MRIISFVGRQVIGGRILTEVFDTEWGSFVTSLDGKFVTMAIDGWSTITSRPFISILVGDQLFNTIDTTGVNTSFQASRLLLFAARSTPYGGVLAESRGGRPPKGARANKSNSCRFVGPLLRLSLVVT